MHLFISCRYPIFWETELWRWMRQHNQDPSSIVVIHWLYCSFTIDTKLSPFNAGEILAVWASIQNIWLLVKDGCFNQVALSTLPVWTSTFHPPPQKKKKILKIVVSLTVDGLIWLKTPSDPQNSQQNQFYFSIHHVLHLKCDLSKVFKPRKVVLTSEIENNIFFSS